MSDKSKKISGFKGFNQDMKCRGFQFEVGKTYEHSGVVKACISGFHFCQNPLDVLKYYGPAKSQYAEVEGEGCVPHSEDSKFACSKLTINASASLSVVISASVRWLLDLVKKPTTGDYAHAATTGYSAHAATTGNCAHAATTGNCAHAATTGDYAHAATTGNCAHAATTGNCAHAATTGYSAHAATTGNCAHAATEGANAIACALGFNARAKSSKGNWIVVSEYDENGTVVCVRTAKVDGRKIKAGIWYELKRGKFVAVQEAE